MKQLIDYINKKLKLKDRPRSKNHKLMKKKSNLFKKNLKDKPSCKH